MVIHNGEVLKGTSGTYQVQAKIGSESTFGAIFKAINQDGVPVVVKQLLGQAHIEQSTGMDYNYVRVTFEREAKILLEHNNSQIVKAHDYFEQNEDLFLILEYINGEDLDQVLIKHMDENNGMAFSEEEVVPIGIEICKVIHSIHQLPGQILYRDMKPRNIMWDAQNNLIKIIDFGTARFMEEGQNATVALGTEGYSPPEFHSTSARLSFASDVYTIGATLYELVTGEIPEPMKTPDHYYGQEDRLSDGFKRVLEKSMQQKAADRYQTAEEMGAALERLPSAGSKLKFSTKAKNPFPYLSCFCPECGQQPLNDRSIYCTQCGGKINVIILKIIPSGDTTDKIPMDLFLDKKENLIGRKDIENKIFPEVDLSAYDPDCYVSRKHCNLKRDGVRFFISALETTNFTKVNNTVLPPGKTREIKDQDEIILANLIVKFEIRPCV